MVAVFEPTRVGGKFTMTMNRANIGVLVTMVNHNGIPVGDLIVGWRDVDDLIERLTAWRADNTQPKHHNLILDPARLGVLPADSK